jgi:hypothetical protein
MRFRVLGSGAIELVGAYRAIGPQSGTTGYNCVRHGDLEWHNQFLFPKKRAA